MPIHAVWYGGVVRGLFAEALAECVLPELEQSATKAFGLVKGGGSESRGNEQGARSEAECQGAPAQHDDCPSGTGRDPPHQLSGSRRVEKTVGEVSK